MKRIAWTTAAGLLLAALGCGQSSTPPQAVAPPAPDAEQLAEMRKPFEAKKMPLADKLKLDEAVLMQRGVDETAADALGRIGPAAIPALEGAMRDADPLVRREAARALARMGAPAEPALPTLIAALKDPDDGVRRAAAQAIGQIGPAAKQAIPALVEALRDHPAEAYP